MSRRDDDQELVDYLKARVIAGFLLFTAVYIVVKVVLGVRNAG